MKDYKAPELVIEEFELEDILTVSGGIKYDGDGMPSEGWY